MKTPDKIYLRQDEVLERMPWIAECYKPDRDVEYIRKDALLELLESERKRHSERYTIEGVLSSCALVDLSKKIESL